jgi:hypothetical protein
VEDARDVGNEKEPIGLEPDCECSGCIVRVDVQRSDPERRDDRDARVRERLDDRRRPAG